MNTKLYIIVFLMGWTVVLGLISCQIVLNSSIQSLVLQDKYDSLVLDWQYCYASNMCLYYPDTCVDWVSKNFGVTDLSAQEIHSFYSDTCTESNSKWNYYFTSFQGNN